MWTTLYHYFALKLEFNCILITQMSSTAEALKKLEDQLTCPTCLGHLTNPKTLPCLHSFCQHCLQAVPLDLVQSDKY